MTLEVRPATEAELTLVRSSWKAQMRPAFRDATAMGPGMRGHQVGRGRFVSQSTAAEMSRLYVDSKADTESVLVAAIPVDDGGSELMGWICRTRCLGDTVVCVQFMYVLKPARRAGLGAALLRYVRREGATVGAKVVPGAMTSPGVGLWGSDKSQ